MGGQRREDPTSSQSILANGFDLVCFMISAGFSHSSLLTFDKEWKREEGDVGEWWG